MVNLRSLADALPVFVISIVVVLVLEFDVLVIDIMGVNIARII